MMGEKHENSQNHDEFNLFFPFTDSILSCTSS